MGRGSGLLIPVSVDAVLEKIIGVKKAGRGEIMKKIWSYIKKHKMQNPENKREILAGKDADWLAFTGGKKAIGMMKLGGLVSKHIVK